MSPQHVLPSARSNRDLAAKRSLLLLMHVRLHDDDAVLAHRNLRVDLRHGTIVSLRADSYLADFVMAVRRGVEDVPGLSFKVFTIDRRLHPASVDCLRSSRFD